jgi:hypothetical protein
MELWTDGTGRVLPRGAPARALVWAGTALRQSRRKSFPSIEAIRVQPRGVTAVYVVELLTGTTPFWLRACGTARLLIGDCRLSAATDEPQPNYS